MKFINFTHNQLTDEQIATAKKEFSQVVLYLNSTDNESEPTPYVFPLDIVSVENPSRFDDDGRKDVTEIIDAIAREIAHLAQWHDAVVLFPISSPRVMASFFEKKAKVKDFDDDIWSFIALRCTFVFSYTRQIDSDRFIFERFVELN